MQGYIDLSKHKWEEVQLSLSSLSGLSLVVYDPSKHRPCTPVTREHTLCHLVHETERESLCQNMFAQQVDLAIQTDQITFSRCQANLNYFIIPIRISPEISYAIVGGKVYHQNEEYLRFRQDASQWGLPQDKLPAALETDEVMSSETFQEIARNVQTLGTALLENIHLRGRYQSKTAYLTTLLQVSNQFKDAASLTDLYTVLLNTLGILFSLRSAALFHQINK